jgi:hypothetical protein
MVHREEVRRTPRPTRFGLFLGLAFFALGFGSSFILLVKDRKPKDPPLASALGFAGFLGVLACAPGAALGLWLDRRSRHTFGPDERAVERTYRLILFRRSRFWLWLFGILTVGLVVTGLIVGYAAEGKQGDGLMGALAVVFALPGACAFGLMWITGTPSSPDLERLVVARHLGFAVLENSASDDFPWVRLLRLWGAVPERYRVGETLAGERAGRSVRVFAYLRVDAALDETQTVYVLEGLPALPAFVLFPVARLTRIGRFLGTAFLPLDGTSLVGKFAAQGEAVALRLFTPEVCALCLSWPDACVEVREGRLVLCVPDRLDTPRDYPAHINHLVQLGAALEAAQPDSPVPVSGPFLPAESSSPERVQEGEQLPRPSPDRPRPIRNTPLQPWSPATPAPQPARPRSWLVKLAASFAGGGFLLSMFLAGLIYPELPNRAADEPRVRFGVILTLSAAALGALVGGILDWNRRRLRAVSQDPDEDVLVLADDLDRDRFAWLGDRLGSEPTRVLFGELDDYFVAVLEGGAPGRGRTVYLVEEVVEGVPAGPLTPESLPDFNWMVGRLCATRPDLAVEVVGANLIAVAPQIEPETHLATLQHLLNLAEALHDSARRRA